MRKPVQRTPLYALHRRLSAKMVVFAGYELPLNYPTGIRREHLHCRRAASLFDVSHMGQLELPYSQTHLTALETLLPLDLQQLPAGEQRYTLLLDKKGGIIDDLLISHDQRNFSLIVNAARRKQCFDLLSESLSAPNELGFRDQTALLALQGPLAKTALEKELPGCGDLRFMQRKVFVWRGLDVQVGRSGYTGEDGFEIAITAAKAQQFASRLLQQQGVKPAGLGARDSLRLEAGLCLYGQDIDSTQTPISAGLTFCISKSRRSGGVRPGGFNGAEQILQALKQPPEWQRCGFVFKGKGLVGRTEAIIDQDGHQVGRITSSGYSFCRQEAIAMGYLQKELLAKKITLYCRKRGRLQPIEPAPLPFIAPRHPTA